MTINVAIDGFEGYGWGLNWLQASVFQPTVSISGGGTVPEDASPATLTVSRDGGGAAWDQPLDVPIMMSGDAELGADSTLSTTTVTIPAGQGSAPFTFTPNWDGVAENDETATFTPAATGQYQVGSEPAVVQLQQVIKNYTVNTTAVIPIKSGKTENVGFTVFGDGKPISRNGIDISSSASVAGDGFGAIGGGPNAGSGNVYSLAVTAGSSPLFRGFVIFLSEVRTL